MCTILDAAEERGVNRGETLKLIMMVQKKIKKGDSIAKIADGLVEDEIVISPIYKMVKEYPEDTERDIYQRVTCSHHLNLTDFEVGASCSIALQGKAKTGYPRVSRGSFFIRLRIFSVLLCTFFIYSFSFFQNIDRRIHIPVHPVSTFA